MSNTLCSFVFGHTDIEPNGDIKFCCAAEAGMNKDANGQVYNVNTHTLKEAWNSETLKQARLEMINGGRPKICNYCWSMENHDNTEGASVRLQAANRRIMLEEIKDRIEYAKTHNGELEQMAFDFQLSIGNLCNFACKMCNSGYSTQFQKFFSKHHSKEQEVNFVLLPPKPQTKHFEFPFGTTFDWPVKLDLMHVFKDHITDVKRIFFTGGEPTLIPQVIDFIEKLAAAGRTNDLTIWPSTNCSNINKRLLDVLEPFQEIWLNLSLDGMGDIAYLQRTPSHWPSIEKNVDTLIDWIVNQKRNGKNVHLSIISTVTALNIHHIMDFWKYFEQRYGHKTHYGVSVNLVKNRGTNLGIEAVPKEIADKLHQICDHKLTTSAARYKDAYQQLKHILQTTEFADTHAEIHFCLDQLQNYHQDMNIKDIYKIYYEQN